MKRSVKSTLFIILILFALTSFNVANTSAAGKYPTVANPMGCKSEYPGQLELEEAMKFFGSKLTFHENPLFKEKVKNGEFPAVEKRLSEEPLILMPPHDIGKYGGTLRGVSRALESGTSEILSWRMVNLVRLSDDLHTMVPNVAKSWKWNNDYTEITFKLRKGHKWSDGEPFTAEDVAFHLNDIINNKDLYPQMPHYWVVGGKPVEIEKIDDTTFKFVFAKPNPGFLFSPYASGYFVPWAPKHFLKKFLMKYNPDADKNAKKLGFDSWVAHLFVRWNKWKDSLTSSPYGFGVPTLESHILKVEPNTQRRIYIANPYYFKVDTAGNQLPYINEQYERFIKDKSVILMEIMNKNIDQKAQSVSLSAYPVLKENEAKGNYRVSLPPGQTGADMVFNQTHKDPVLRKIYGDIRFRQAMSLAMNRDEINNVIYLGVAKPQQAVPLNCTFVTEEDENYMTEYNPEKANKLLDDMGLKKGPDGIRLRPDGKPLTVLWEYSTQFAGDKFVTLVSYHWKAVGINVVAKEITTETTRVKGKNNELDINMEWDVPYENNLISEPEMYIPPYSDIVPLVGVPWVNWIRSNGTTGEEAPRWVTRLYELAAEFPKTLPGSKRYMEIGREMVQINLKNMVIIRSCGDRPNPTVVSNRLGNVTKWKIQNYNYRRAYSFRADLWFFKQ
jgi:peptide/nickel transport system substrate-binding protein